jgi:hypothetical protein
MLRHNGIYFRRTPCIIVYLGEINWDGVDLSYQTEDRGLRQALLNAAMNLHKSEEFLE